MARPLAPLAMYAWSFCIYRFPSAQWRVVSLMTAILHDALLASTGRSVHICESGCVRCCGYSVAFEYLHSAGFHNRKVTPCLTILTIPVHTSDNETHRHSQMRLPLSPPSPSVNVSCHQILWRGSAPVSAQMLERMLSAI